MQILGGIEDPYVERSSVVPESVIDRQDWPDMEYPDIYNYLIDTPSLYRKEQPAILSLVPGFSHNCVPHCVRNMLPRPLIDVFKEEYMDLSYSDLFDKSEEHFRTIKITPAQLKTRSQF